MSGIFSFECPTSRGSTEETPLKLLTSAMYKLAVCIDYVNDFPKLSEVAKEWTHGETPDRPLTFSAFRRFWDKSHPASRVSKKGSNFCDLCTGTEIEIYLISTSDPGHACILGILWKHREEARKEHDYYRDTLKSAKRIQDSSMQHIVFAYAETLLLLHLLRQSGQLYFITGLKF